jgi:hypothetical protein
MWLGFFKNVGAEFTCQETQGKWTVESSFRGPETQNARLVKCALRKDAFWLLRECGGGISIGDASQPATATRGTARVGGLRR